MKSIIVSFLILFTLNIFSQDCGLIINTSERKTESLNGKWSTIIDPYETGYYNYRYKPSKYGFFNDAKPKEKWERIEYSFDDDNTLSVPGDWNSQDEKLFFYEGTVWYKKSFQYNLASNKRLYIYFGAVNYDAKIYINGKKIGEHIGGFTPFNFEITNNITEGENSLIVKVDNKRFDTAVPTLNTDWWNFGGITRDVKLVEVPKIFISDYFIQLTKKTYNKISGYVKIYGSNNKQNVTISIPELNISEKFSFTKDGLAEVEFDASPILWTPKKPKLYKVIIKSETDVVNDLIGFRTIETKGNEILLNGTPIFLAGVSIHEDAPFRNGRNFSKEEDEILLRWAKEMNCNFVRLAHYPHNEHMLKLADKMGLMVWSEIPVYWTIKWDNEETLTNAKNQLSEMITRDKNRASVIIWSMANETPLSDERLKFLNTLVNRTKELDPTRLISAAMESHYENDSTIVIDDPFGEVVDVLGCNEYIGWYDGLPKKCNQIKWKSKYNKPLIMSEFGAGALYGKHGDKETRWTEEYQEDLYIQQIKMLKKIKFLCGTSPWILKDFMSPKRLLPKVQDYYNLKGLISNSGNRKPAFFIMQEFYEEVKANYSN